MKSSLFGGTTDPVAAEQVQGSGQDHRRSGPVPLAILLLVSSSSLLAQISGTVINGTTGEPQAGATVNLIHPGENGMQTMGAAKSDAEGNFKIDQPLPPPPALLQADFEDVQYNLFLQPGAPTQGLSLSVFNSTSQASKASIEQQHLVVFDAMQEGIKVTETFLVNNTGKTSLLDPVKGSVEFFVPKEAQGSAKVTVEAPSGMPITRAPEKTSQSDVFKVGYPVKPGQTVYEVAYILPPSKSFAGKMVGKSPVLLVTAETVTLSGDALKDDGTKDLQDGKLAHVYELTAADGAAYTLTIDGVGTLETPSQGQAQGSEDDGSPKNEAGPARLYQRVYWVLGLTFSILGLGGVLLYRRSEA